MATHSLSRIHPFIYVKQCEFIHLTLAQNQQTNLVMIVHDHEQWDVDR